MPWTKRIFFFESCFIPSASLGPPPRLRPGKSASCNSARHGLVLVGPEKQSRRTYFLLNTVSQGGKPLGGPGLEPPPGPRVETDERPMGVYPGFPDQSLGRYHCSFPDDERGRGKGAHKAQSVRRRQVVWYC